MLRNTVNYLNMAGTEHTDWHWQNEGLQIIRWLMWEDVKGKELLWKENWSVKGDGCGLHEMFKVRNCNELYFFCCMGEGELI